MKIDKSKLYDSYYKDDNGNKIPMYSEDESVFEPIKYSKTLTKHYNRACERTDEICDHTGKKLGIVGQSWSNELVTAMVRSGDFDVHDAIIVVTDCCERCLNILHAKYLDQKPEESSYFYKNWDSPCVFCDEEDDKYILPTNKERINNFKKIPTQNVKG